VTVWIAATCVCGHEEEDHEGGYGACTADEPEEEIDDWLVVDEEEQEGDGDTIAATDNLIVGIHPSGPGPYLVVTALDADQELVVRLPEVRHLVAALTEGAARLAATVADDLAA
jgi:hypothetical protein